MPDIYGGRDPRDVPAYGIAEAAKYLKIPPATLRPWVAGRQYLDGRKTFHPLIATPKHKPPYLSFHNLIEAHVLRALRTRHGIAIHAVREAIDFAQKELHIERLLLSKKLRTAAGQLFTEKYGEIVQLKPSGQLVIADLFRAHLERIDWERDLPVRLYPFLTAGAGDTRRGIVIDAHRAFGRPIIARRGISIAVIVDRIDAGEHKEVLAADYGLTPEEIREALDYEQAA